MDGIKFTRNEQAKNSRWRALLRLHTEVVAMVESKQLGEYHAYRLKVLSKPDQHKLAIRIKQDKLSVRDVELAVQEKLKYGTDRGRAGHNSDIDRVDRLLTETLGARATFRGGVVKISLGDNLDVFDGFLQKIGASLDK